MQPAAASNLPRIKFNLWHLAIEADGLVIHGFEASDEAPYLAADKIFVRVKIMTFLEHSTGAGLASHIGLSLLRIEQPHVHLIIDKNGKTNQPVPKHPTASTEPLQNTLLDLKVNDAELVNGLAVLNDRAIPFDLAARDLQARVNYVASSDQYAATVDLNDLRTKMQKAPEAQSKLHVEAELGRDAFNLKTLDFLTGSASNIHASASINHFANPEWQAAVNGKLDLKQISVLSAADGLDAGTLDLDVKGRNCEVAPAEAQKKPSIFRRRKNDQAKQPVKQLPPDPDCKSGYLLVGSAKLNGASYRDANVRLHDINGGAQLHITPTELLFTALTGYLPGGGSATGELRIVNWLGEVPPATATNAVAASPTVVGAATTANKTAAAVGAQVPVTGPPTPITPVERAHAYLKVTVDKIPLRTIMDITATPDTETSASTPRSTGQSKRNGAAR